MGLSLTVLENPASGIAACLMLESRGKKILLDCGYDDSGPRGQSPAAFPVRPDSIEAVILSHGHLGHCGLLAILVRDGFSGKVYCPTKAVEIALASMMETALMQEEEAGYWMGKEPQHAILPVYSKDEVCRCQSLFVPCQYHQPVHLHEDFLIRFFRAGHGTGSAFVQLLFREGAEWKAILYFGDLGTGDNDLTIKTVTDVPYESLLVPAHPDIPAEKVDIQETLAKIIHRTQQSGGNVLIPVFSMDRRNAILKLIRDLCARKRIPSLFVFVDSPIARAQSKSLIEGLDGSVACQLIDTVGDSKSLNQIQGTAIILAGSGRGDWGRILFHLKRHLPRPENAVVLFGDYAHETIWDSLLKGCTTIPILGTDCDVKAETYKLSEPTHLGRAEIARWLGGLKHAPKQICITHGNPETKQDFQEYLKRQIPCEIRVPREGNVVGIVS